MKRKVVIGILLIIIGLAIVFWAYNHSPHAALGDRLMSELSGSFTLSKQQYAGSMIAGLILGLAGIYTLFKK
jgi:uncharacterized membrane protein